MPSKAKQQKKLEEDMKRQEELCKRAQEAADKLFKQHERERVQNEKTDKTKREAEQHMRMLERERLAREQQLYKPIGSDKDHRLLLALREYEKHKEWEHIVVDSWLPNVNSEADVNDFLSNWEEENNDAGEDTTRNLDIDFAGILDAYHLIQNILAEQDKAVVADMTGKGNDKILFHTRSLIGVYEMILSKLDTMTANMLQFLDKYIDQDEEQGITLCKENEALQYGLWAGDRRPRHRGIDYRELGVSIGPKEGAYVPKALDLVKERGIRVMQMNFDPMTIQAYDQEPGSQYHALGCVLFIEVLQYPKLPSQVKEWTLRHETVLAHGLQRHPYPPAQTTDLDGAKPLKVSFVVPPNIVVRHLAPFVGIWSPELKAWQMQGTTDFDFKRDTRTVSFGTQHLACMAIIQEKGFDVPYEEWSLIPLSDNEVLFTIEGRRRGEISDREVQILVKDNMCKVVVPDEPELDPLRDSWHTPATLLRKLSDSGYNFIFTDGDAAYFPDVLPKSRKMELLAYEDVANFCTMHAFCSSRHNAARPGLQPGITCEGPTEALFRISHDTRLEGSTAALKPEPHKWNTIRYV